MNRLLALLRAEGSLSSTGLKRLYRILSKKAHPDLVSGAGEQFLRLCRDYEEALAVLGRGGAESAIRGERTPTGELRIDFLGHLYLYALRFPAAECRRALEKIAELATAHNDSLHALLADYREVLIDRFEAWHQDGDTYYAHNMFIAAVKQLAYYIRYGHPRHRRLLQVYTQDRKVRSRRLDSQTAAILVGLAEWLEREVDRAPPAATSRRRNGVIWGKS